MIQVHNWNETCSDLLYNKSCQDKFHWPLRKIYFLCILVYAPVFADAGAFNSIWLIQDSQQL